MQSTNLPTVLCWSLSWSLPVSLFCAGFLLVSAGLCRLGLGNPTWEIQLGKTNFGKPTWGNQLGKSNLGKSTWENQLGKINLGFAVLCWFCAGLCWSLPVPCFVLVLQWSLLLSAGFAFLCWFCAGLCWSLPVSLFCAGFVLVSAGRCRSRCFVLAGFVLVAAGLCRFRCFVLVLRWSLLVSASFAVLCWFCAGLCWSLPVSLFCAGFVLVSAGL